MATPVCTIDVNGLHVPAFPDILLYFQNAYLGIYGADVYLGNDSQDGQFIGLLANALNDTNSECASVYNAFSPATAQGAGLSSVVKINGMARKIPSFSTCDLTIVGQAGTIIVNGVATDINDNQWNLPPSVVIPLSGQIVVTATAAEPGAVAAGLGSIVNIVTPTFGWQSVINFSAATPGQPLETDAALRIRQSISTSIPSVTVLDGILGVIASLSDVARFRAYENDTTVPDNNGIPGHSIALVIDGGDAGMIASIIAAKKTPGAGTYGTIQETVVDIYGIRHVISFFQPTLVPIYYNIIVTALAGFTTDVQALIQQTLSDWTNGLGIGNSLLLTRAYGPANLNGGTGYATFEIQSITIAAAGGAFGASDIPIAFNQAPSCLPTSVIVGFTPQGVIVPLIPTIFIDRSGFILVGGTSQTASPFNVLRQRLIIQNPASASSQGVATAESLFFNFTAPASTFVGSSFELLPGETYDTGEGRATTTEPVTITAATTGHRFIIKEL